MRAMQLQSLDGPPALTLVEIAEPVAEPEDVLIDVHAAGVSFVDLLVSRGLYQVRFEPPVVQGMEVAGTVRSAPSASPFVVGDRVAAFVTHGAFADVVAAPASMTFRLPESFSFQEGAAYILNYHTVHFALVRRGRLTGGERVLVHGGAGGVGTAAIQIAKAMGCEVVATVRSPQKAAVATAAGADDVVIVGEAGWLADAQAAGRGGGFDVAVDPVGGPVADDTVRALGPEGRYLILGFAGGGIPAVKFNRLLLRNVELVGVGWGAFLPHDATVPGTTDQALSALAQQGAIRPIIGKTYRLDDAAQALIDIEQGQVVGKLILEVR